jgi:hypothetical protein
MIIAWQLSLETGTQARFPNDLATARYLYLAVGRREKTNRHQNTWRMLHWQIINTNYVKFVLKVLRALNYEHCKTLSLYVGINLYLGWHLCTETTDKLYIQLQICNPASLESTYKGAFEGKRHISTSQHSLRSYTTAKCYTATSASLYPQISMQEEMSDWQGQCNRLLCVHNW